MKKAINDIRTNLSHTIDLDIIRQQERMETWIKMWIIEKPSEPINWKFILTVLAILIIIPLVFIPFWQTNASEVQNTSSLCQNMYMSNNTQWLISYNCDIEKISSIVDNVKTKSIEYEEQGYYSEIKWGKYKQPVQVFDTQVNEMIKRWYKLTRILDLLTIKTMECNRYDWKCFNWNDVWHFQINKIHKLQYIKSHELFYNSWELYKYQLSYANELVESYMDRFCDWKRAWDNETRFKCIAKSYNWHPRYKQTYADLWWAKRKLITEYIVKSYPLLTN